jgi:hypothetical protein
MNELNRFEQLVAGARAERVPPIDVTTQVLRGIRAMAAPRGIDGPLVLVSGISALAASVVAALAAEMWLELVDPLSGFFNSLTMVMQ